MDIRNCKDCGKLFNYVGKRICPDCVKKIEEKFQEVKEYIRNNPNASIAQVSIEKDVSILQIQHWIREERLILTIEALGNSFLCESCGRPIQTGRYCEKCKQKTVNEMSHVIDKSVSSESDDKRAGITKDKMWFLDKNK